jgi:TetR/AcrR family transcriptional regulator, cholesterol catabolism regulator
MNDELKNILTKVRILYMKYGIKSVTMDDVARELGISKKTLYQYVNDKNELVTKVVEMELLMKGEFYSKMCCPGLNAIEEIFEVHKMVRQLLKDYNPATDYDLRKYYPELFASIVKVRREMIYHNILSNLEKGKTEGLYRLDLNSEMIAKLQLSRVESAFNDEIFTQDELLSPKLFHEMFVYHIRGIANEKGIAVLDEKLKEVENINN